jgi:phosphoglycolate phosphatase
MNLFFDLDGTLIDSKLRLYKLFQYLVRDSNLSFEAYWDLKQNKINHREILYSKFNYSSNDYLNFETLWMKKIEEPEWLVFDRPFDGVIGFFEKLKMQHQIFVVTARQHRDVALMQVEEMGLNIYIKEVLVTEQMKSKFDLIKNSTTVSSSDWIVGDTGKDIETGKMLGIKTAAVLSGFMNKKSLIEYEPEIIVEKVTDLIFN